MRIRSNAKFVVTLCSVLAFVMAVWSPAQSQSTQTEKDKMNMESKMAERCQAMTEQKEKMMADMKAQDAALATQVARMNGAPDDNKLALLAAVVTRMVEQRTAMNVRMAKMQVEMMKHMMQHVEMGKDSMSKCPMMKGMIDMSDKSGGAHTELEQGKI